jgi:type II secretory pathway component GspD/PulD (secretin)
MRISHILFAAACAAVVAIGAVYAGQKTQVSQVNQEPSLVRRVYSINDLLCLPKGTADLLGLPNGDDASKRDGVESLLEHITQTVDPQSWAEVGGGATIQYYPNGKVLVVNQTQANHEAIVSLLVSLRQQLVEVATEHKLISLSPAKARIFLMLAGFQENCTDEGGASTNVAFLNEQQLKAWMELFQEDRRTNVMQAPKITTFTGQQADMAIGDEIGVPTLTSSEAGGAAHAGEEKVFFGIKSNFTSTVSADKRFTRVQLNWQATNLDWSTEGQPSIQRLALSSTVMVPDNGTAVFCVGSNWVQERQESGPPVLSKIPYLNRLFTNCGYHREEQVLFLLVTPRILDNAEANPTTAVGECSLPRIPR